MCLSTKMSPKKRAEFKEQTEGWKVFREREGQLFGEWFGQVTARPIGEWLNEKSYSTSPCTEIVYGRRLDCYESGWHIWLTMEDAKKWVDGREGKVIRKVEFRKPVAYGRQDRHPVVVAKEMMILKEAQ